MILFIHTYIYIYTHIYIYGAAGQPGSQAAGQPGSRAITGRQQAHAQTTTPNLPTKIIPTKIC